MGFESREVVTLSSLELKLMCRKISKSKGGKISQGEIFSDHEADSNGVLRGPYVKYWTTRFAYLASPRKTRCTLEG